MNLVALVAPVCGAMLVVGAALTLVRLWRGPSTPDRAIAVDVLVALLLCGLGVLTAVQRTATFVPVLLVLALLGFVGSATVARFVGRDDR